MLTYQEFKEKYKLDNKELKTSNKEIFMLYKKYKYEQELNKKYIIINFMDGTKIDFN